MESKQNSDKNILPDLLFGLIFMSIISLIILIRPKDVGSKESFQKLNDLKNQITCDSLSKCKIETSKCVFNIEEVDLNELAEYLRNSKSAYAPGHSLPLASLTFKEIKDDEYLIIDISIYEKNNNKVTALFNCELFRNDTGLASNFFSSTELTEWAKKYLTITSKKKKEI